MLDHREKGASDRNRRGGRAQPNRPPGRPKASGNTVGPEELVSRCAELLKETPPAQLTFAALARYAGVTPSTITYYFPSKGELLVAVADKLLRDIQSDVSEGDDLDDPWMALRAHIKALVRSHQLHPYLHDLLLSELIHSASELGRRVFQDATDRSIGRLEGFIQRGVDRGVMRPVDVVHLHMILIGACEIFTTARPIRTYLQPDTTEDVAAEAYTDTILQLLANGLRPEDATR